MEDTLRRGRVLDIVRPFWCKVTESEQRLALLETMVRKELVVRANGKKVKLDESAVDESDEETDYELAEAKERQILTRLVKRLTILSGEQQIAKIQKCICLN